MRRDPLIWLLALALALLAGLAWLTRHPGSPVLERVAGWPGLGPLAERFRQAYRPPPLPSPGGEVEVVVLPRPPRPAAPGAADPTRPTRRVWIRPGTELRASPDPASGLQATVPSFVRMEVLERNGPWSRVRRLLADGRSTEGWARLGELPEPSAEELWRPEPVLPLPATPPEPGLVAWARELMAGGGRQSACGPYLLLDDLADPELPARCARLAGELERIYRLRYGLRPAGPPAEAILVFASRGAYLLFRQRAEPDINRPAFAAPAAGIVALAAGDSTADQLQATLTHELAHLLNRRFLGPALPPWLDEGLAEEMAMSRFGAGGAPLTGTLGRWQRPLGGGAVVSGGGEVDLATLREELATGELPTLEELVELDRDGFQRPERFAVHYPLSGFWVRYLLSGDAPAEGDGFRGFLGAVAGGEPLGEELLLGRLGTDWGELEAGFRGWLAAGARPRPVSPS